MKDIGIRPRRRFGALSGIGFVLVAAVLGFAACAPGESGQREEVQEAVMATTFEIDGMSCEGCVSGIRGALERMAGVTAVEVTLEPPHATVSFRPSVTSVDTLREGIEAIGYEVLSTRDGAPGGPPAP